MFCLVLLVLIATFLAAASIPDASQLGDSAPQFGRIPRQPGCFCLRSSLHNHMCRGDFVIKAKILDDNLGRGRHRQALHGYQILVKDIFNLPPHDKLKAGDKVALYTPANVDFCGTSFVRRNTYLLSGRIVENILVVTSCDYSRKWSTITTSIQRSLNVLPHKRHCSCKIYGCNGEICGEVESGDAFNVFETSRCFTKRDTLQERCYEDYGECRMSNRGSCSWRSQRKPKVCMNVARRRMRNT